MSDALHLTITTPAAILVDSKDVRSVRAEDASGGFGILPGHTDLLTVLPASVIRWHGDDGIVHYCVLRGGVLAVAEGRRVEIACREGKTGDDLNLLAGEVRALREAELDIERRARVEQMRLHTRTVRQLIRYLRPSSFGEGGEALMRKGDAP